MSTSIFSSGLPAVSFSAQAVVLNFPNELHEAIVMTDELRAWAASHVPVLRERSQVAQRIERGALHLSDGDESWMAVGGPAAARERDHLDHLQGLLELLARGQVASSWHGWIDRREWAAMVAELNIERKN